MKIKINFLMIIVLLVAQMSTSFGTVAAQDEITIGPDLPAAVYGTLYSQQLTASGGNGDYIFSLLSGTLPNGFSLSERGLLTGQGYIYYDSVPGTYPITIQVVDTAGVVGSRFYNFVLEKGIPTMTPYASGSGILGSTIYYNHPFTLWAELWIGTSYVYGKANFYVDGNAVPGCQEVVLDYQFALCRDIEMNLSLGEHTFRVDYLPTVYEEYFQPASASGTFTVESGSYDILGTLFRDNDQDGVFDYDSEVRLYDIWTINLDQDCDKVVDMTATTTSYGRYQFLDLPGGHCYRITEVVNPGWQQTTQLTDFWLSSHIDYGLDIGNFRPTITLSPSVLPSGNVGVPYSQTFTASGGAAPYTFTISDSTLPAGLVLSTDGILAGTPTAGGSFQITVQVVDANQAFASQNYYFTIKTDGVFTFSSSSNPSALGESVTFTLSATGDVEDPYYGILNPAGFVTFYADETPIESCSDLVLNYDGNTGLFGYYPLTCTTTVLSLGIHQISATFTDYFGIYNAPTLALTQNVDTIFITPDTLSAEYNTTYSQQLTASGGTGTYTFSLVSGTLPNGVTLSESGLISGYPDGTNLGKPGIYPISIQVQDSAFNTTSRAFDFVLDKGTPTMTVKAENTNYWNNPFNLWATVTMPIDQSGGYSLSGTAAFIIDGTPVPGCQAVPSADGGFLCSAVAMNISVGTHTVEATYTPTGWYADYYYTANAGNEFSVQPSHYTIQGSLFSDTNQNGVWDYSAEYGMIDAWTVNLDQGCDGTVDQTASAYYRGYYAFYNVSTSGECFRITADTKPGWQQTSHLEDFRLTEPLYSMNFGYYYPTITFSPSELSSGSVGLEYNQSFTAIGGAEPYTFTISGGTLPDGLTLSADGILSGTPTVTGSFFFYVQAEDINHAVGSDSYPINIKTDGVFTFTSSSNPSAPGETVTFAVSATGDAIHSYYGVIPPLGLVTFFANETPIEGCSDLILNITYDEYDNMIIGNYPATCSTATLGTGIHQITATFNDYTNVYNAPSLALTQTVQPVTSADLSIGKTDSKDPVKPGAQLIYTLTTRNAGPNAALSVVIVDTLDRNTTFVSAKAPRGWTCKYVNYAVTCTSASLSSGGSAIIKITVIVNKTAQVGKDLVNNATVTSTTYDPNLTNNSVVQKTLVTK